MRGKCFVKVSPTQPPVSELLGESLDADALHEVELARAVEVQNGFEVARRAVEKEFTIV